MRKSCWPREKITRNIDRSDADMELNATSNDLGTAPLLKKHLLDFGSDVLMWGRGLYTGYMEAASKCGANYGNSIAPSIETHLRRSQTTFTCQQFTLSRFKIFSKADSQIFDRSNLNIIRIQKPEIMHPS